MTVSTIWIVKHFVNKKREIQPNTREFSREKQFAKSVIIIDVCSLITHLPLLIADMIKSRVDYTLYDILHGFSQLLILISASFHFFVLLYCNKVLRVILFQYFFVKEIRLQ